jgi:ABC-type amino acid transport substrate-binding protein
MLKRLTRSAGALLCKNGAAALLSKNSAAALLFALSWVAAPAATPATAVQVATAAVSAPPPAAPAAAEGRRKAPEFNRIAARGELIVAMLKTDTPPFFFERQGRLQGLDVELALELGKSLGVPVRFDRSAGSFNEVVDKVSRGEADLGISKISRTLARAQAVLFSDPYLTLHHGLILNRLEFARLARERTPAQALRDFNGSLGVIANSSFYDYAQRNFPKARVVPFPTWGEVVAAVERGQVVGGYRDEFEVKRLLAEHPQAALKLRTVTLKDEIDAIGIAVGADAPTLQSYVNLFLATRKTQLDVASVLKALPATEVQAP